MGDLFLLSERQMARISPFFPLSHGVPRVDDRCERHRLRDPQRSAVEGCAGGLFARLKDWRRIATRYDRCAHTFFSAIRIAAAVIFWI